MNSIRPLVTITILLVVAVFLFWQINQAPAPLGPGTKNGSDVALPAGVPTLAATAGNGSTSGSATLTPGTASSSSATGGGTAAPWPLPAVNAAGGDPPSLAFPPGVSPPAGSDLKAFAPAPNAKDSAVTVPMGSLPEVPAIPDLPPLASSTDAANTTKPSSPMPQIELPSNIPTARYSTDAADSEAPEPPTLTPMSPPQSMASPTPNPWNDKGVSPMSPPSPPQPQSPTASAGDVGSQPHGDDRYGPIPAGESAKTFATSWPAIQAALARQDLAQAHQLLSKWYESPTLTAVESQQVETLLNQLAGTVVYSTENRLEPAYVVRAGDTLQTIAQQFDVPWQLLAKINGIPSADMVQPGQQLKVVKGPFSAQVNLTRSELTLMLDDRYAGRFPIQAEAAAAASEGVWVVEQKLANPPATSQAPIGSSYAINSGSVDRVIVLRNASATAGAPTISITGGAASPAGPTAVAPAAIRLAPADAEEVADILSVGSRVTIRR